MMKKLLFLFLVTLSVFSNAQTTIKMEKDAGIYKIPCKVNGAPMKMYFDTGASVVSISKATAMYLVSNDLIDESDYIGTTKSLVADGSVVDNMVIRLKDIEIGGLHLKDIKATISSSLNAPLLLGQSVISKLGKITLNGNLLVIHSLNAQSLSKEERDELDNKLRVLRANRTEDEQTNYKILDIIKKIERSEELNEFELFCKLVSEANEYQDDEVIKDAATWIEKYALDTDSINMKMTVYLASAKSNICSENGNKELGMEHLKRCSGYFKKDTTSHSYWYVLPLIHYEYCKFKRSGFEEAISACKASIDHFCKYYNISIEDINQNKNSNSTMLYLFSTLPYIYTLQYDTLNDSKWTKNQIKMVYLVSILAAKSGNQQAKEYCIQNKLNYKKELSKKELEFVGIEDF
jgi:clan AA aspartic protease (TIGR02281 family)